MYFGYLTVEIDDEISIKLAQNSRANGEDRRSNYDATAKPQPDTTPRLAACNYVTVNYLLGLKSDSKSVLFLG